MTAESWEPGKIATLNLLEKLIRVLVTKTGIFNVKIWLLDQTAMGRKRKI